MVVRETNVDLIAAKLATLAKKDDLIIVSPWYAGISFNRYYTGTTPWVTVPELRDTTLQRYDLIKEKMVEERPLAHLLEKMHEVLQRGNTVWVAGQLPWVSPKTHLGRLRPAPDPVTGWWVCAYDEHWAREVAQDLGKEATGRSVIMVPAGIPVNPYENFCIEARRVRIHR